MSRESDLNRFKRDQDRFFEQLEEREKERLERIKTNFLAEHGKDFRKLKREFSRILVRGKVMSKSEADISAESLIKKMVQLALKAQD